MKVVLDRPKPSESFNSSSKKLRKFKKISKLNQTVKATRDMTEIKNVEIIILQ